MGLDLIRAVLFDVDGVLLESDEALVQAFTRTLMKFGFRKPTPQEVLRHSGLTGGQWLRALIPKHSHKRADEMHPYLARLYATRYLPQMARVMPGADEAIFELRRKGVKTAVITNMWRWVVDSVFRRFGLEKGFDTIVASDELPVSKPGGLPLRVALQQLGVHAEDALFIGDTETDVRAGRHAGVRVVLLNHSRNRNVRGAWRRIDSMAELPSIVERG